jgi:RHS repeat-associated protein
VPADYDGDGDDDVANFDGGAWHFWDYATGACHGVWTGTSPGCVPAPADYDGDGNADLSLKCGGAWFFYNDNGTLLKSLWTGATDSQLPVPGDYNGDGRADPAISNGAAWDIYDYVSGIHTGGVFTGNNGTPVPMDYDGDGTTDVVVFNAGGWHVYHDDGSYDQGLWTAAGTIPLHGNFGGDLTEEPAIYSGGAWSIYAFTGMPIARHHSFPFGEEISSIRQDGEQMKLTGHERDLGISSSAADDLDYMHARHYSALTGGFVSTDKAPGAPRRPQSWNRYAYVRRNPLKLVDPNGDFGLSFQIAVALATKVRNFLGGLTDTMVQAGGGGLGPSAPSGDTKSPDYTAGQAAGAGLATHDTVLEVAVSGDLGGFGGLSSPTATGGVAVVNGTDFYAFGGLGESASVSPLSVSVSSGIVANYTGAGSYGGPFVGASAAPFGPSVAGNPLNPEGTMAIGLIISSDLGVSQAVTY